MDETILNFFNDIKGAPILRLRIVTTPRTRAGSPTITKDTTIVVQVGCHYGRKVTKATGEDYTGTGRQWGELSPNRVIVTHKG